MAYPKIPPLASWRIFGDLRRRVECATQLEGMAVWAAYGRREAEGALEQDETEDYRILDDPSRMKDLRAEYHQALASLAARGEAAATPEDRERGLESFGSPRLGHRVGAWIAREIEARKGALSWSA